MAKFICVTELIGGDHFTQWELGDPQYIPISHILSFGPAYRIKDKFDLIVSNLDKIPDEMIRHHFSTGKFKSGFTDYFGTSISLQNPCTLEKRNLIVYEQHHEIYQAIEK